MDRRIAGGRRRWNALLLLGILGTGLLPLARGQNPVPPRLAPRSATNPVELELALPDGRPGTAEPLLTTGEVGRGDTIFVYYEAPGRIRFGWDSSASGIIYSSTVVVEGPGEHRLLASMGSLLPRDGSGVSETSPSSKLLRSLLLLELDGRTVWRISGKFQPPGGPVGLTLGANRIGSATLEPFFTGKIGRVRAVAPGDALSEAMQVGRWLPLPGTLAARYPGAVRLRLRFPRNAMPAADPVLVTGRTGKGDFIYVQVVDSRHLRFGFDHWSVGGIVSPVAEADLAAAHEIVVTMDSLYAPAVPAVDPWRGQVIVWLDGRRVLSGQSACHPTTAEQIILAYNLIGGSTTGIEFRGSILGVEAVSAAELARLAP